MPFIASIHSLEVNEPQRYIHRHQLYSDLIAHVNSLSSALQHSLHGNVQQPDPGALFRRAGYHGRKYLTNSRFEEESSSGLGHLPLYFSDDILFPGAVLCQRIQLLQTVGYRPFLNGSL